MRFLFLGVCVLHIIFDFEFFGVVIKAHSGLIRFLVEDIDFVKAYLLIYKIKFSSFFFVSFTTLFLPKLCKILRFPPPIFAERRSAAIS